MHGTQIERNGESSEVAIVDRYERAVRGEGPWIGDPQVDRMLGSRLGVFGPRVFVKPITIIGMENDVGNGHVEEHC